MSRKWIMKDKHGIESCPKSNRHTLELYNDGRLPGNLLLRREGDEEFKPIYEYAIDYGGIPFQKTIEGLYQNAASTCSNNVNVVAKPRISAQAGECYSDLAEINMMCKSVLGCPNVSLKKCETGETLILTASTGSSPTGKKYHRIISLNLSSDEDMTSQGNPDSEQQTISSNDSVFTSLVSRRTKYKRIYASSSDDSEGENFPRSKVAKKSDADITHQIDRGANKPGRFASRLASSSDEGSDGGVSCSMNWK